MIKKREENILILKEIKRKKGDIYIINIIDEEMKSNDERLR